MTTQAIAAIEACVFDAYGTPFDVTSAARNCIDFLGDKADVLAADAMLPAFTDLKLVLEPRGGAALAAALSGAIAVTNKTIAVAASGGNIDRRLFATTLESGRH